jgi:hypothetical protein
MQIGCRPKARLELTKAQGVGVGTLVKRGLEWKLMIANRDIQRRLASFTRAEATRVSRPASLDQTRFYAAMASQVPVRPDRPGAVDPVSASRLSDTPFLLRR